MGVARPFRVKMRLVDRLLLRRMLAPFAGALVTIVCVMSLENMSRLLGLLEHVRSPGGVLGRMMLLLLPEYAAIGLLVGLFLSVATAVRNAALAGEWQILGAIGLSPARLMLIPATFGVMCGGAQLAVRLHLQPLAEQRLDALGADIRRGAYGLGAAIGEVKAVSDKVVLSVEGVDPRSHDLLGLFLKTPEGVFTAQSARASYDARGDLQLLLKDGIAVPVDAPGRASRVAFRTYAMRIPMEGPAAVRTSLRDALDRLTLDSLVQRIRATTEHSGGGALAALVARCSYAGFSLLLPFLAVALATPPPRGRSGLGLMAGILVIVGFIKGASFLEMQAAQPIIAFSIFLSCWAVITFALWRYEARHGPGSCETWLNRYCARPFAFLLNQARTASKRPGPAPQSASRKASA